MLKVLNEIRQKLMDVYFHQYDLILSKVIQERSLRYNNPLTKNPQFFGFSQSDEDSIIQRILKKLNLKTGFFVEIGVGNGLENNTLNLLARGWHGLWIGNENILPKIYGTKLKFLKKIITKENVSQLLLDYEKLNEKINLLSLDIDGNDYYVVEEILKLNLDIDIFITEYNPKFCSDIEYVIDYNPKHIWSNDDYYGSSLKSQELLFKKNGYFLVCCNLSGANAFFVKNSYKKKFSDIPKQIDELFVDGFNFHFKTRLHKKSLKTIEKIINYED